MSDGSLTFRDPMLTRRTTITQSAPVPAYLRRPTQYFSATANRIVDIVPSTPLQSSKQPAPAPAVGAPTDLEQAAAPAEGGRSSLWHVFRSPLVPRAVLYGMASVVFVAGLAVSLNGMKANHQVAAQVKHAQTQTAQSVADNVVPTATKPSAAQVANYTVAPNLPRYLDIPKLGIHARVLSEGVTKSGQLQVPWNIADTGWYNASAQPGQQGGMLIDGHSGIGGLHGVFYNLASLAAGDQLTVTRGDNQKFTYTVIKVQTVGAADVNMSSMVVSAGATKPGLNLITCAGDQIPGTDQLNERIQVYAVEE